MLEDHRFTTFITNSMREGTGPIVLVQPKSSGAITEVTDLLDAIFSLYQNLLFAKDSNRLTGADFQENRKALVTLVERCEYSPVNILDQFS